MNMIQEIKQEIFRKLFHINLLIFPILFTVLGKFLFLAILIPISIITIFLDSLRKKNPQINLFFVKIFGKIMRQSEIEECKLSGVSWVFLSACVVFLFFKPAIAITAFLILAISDALAAIVGKSLESAPFFEKSTAGSLAFLVSAILVVITCGLIYDCKFLFYVFGFVVACIVTIIEARPSLFDINDNFSIPLFFAFFMTIFDFMWHFIT